MRISDGVFLSWWLQKRRGNQRGSLLIEIIVVLAILGSLGIPILSAVQTTYIASHQFDVQSTAENLIRNQLDDVLLQPYKAPDDPNPTYLTITPPDGYSIIAESRIWDADSLDISTLRITVFYHDESLKVYETLRSRY